MIAWARSCPFLVVLLAVALPAAADEFRPAYLQLKQVDDTTYDVLWKVPALDANTTLRLKPVFPEGTRQLTKPVGSFANNATVLRWRVAVDGGLAGKAVAFPDLPGSRVDVLVRVERADGTEQLGRVLPVDPRFEVTASPGHLEVVKTYTVLGIGHILLGFDHLLFVLALLLIVDGTRRLIATITAFTVAHSITLALAIDGSHPRSRPAGRGAHRAQHRLRRRGDHPPAARQGQPDAALSLGRGFHVRPAARASVSPAHSPKSGCRRTRSRWRCCSSMSASRSGSCCSSRPCWPSSRSGAG